MNRIGKRAKKGPATSTAKEVEKSTG